MLLSISARGMAEVGLLLESKTLHIRAAVTGRAQHIHNLGTNDSVDPDVLLLTRTAHLEYVAEEPAPSVASLMSLTRSSARFSSPQPWAVRLTILSDVMLLPCTASESLMHTHHTASLTCGRGHTKAVSRPGQKHNTHECVSKLADVYVCVCFCVSATM